MFFNVNMVYQFLCECRAMMACTVNSSFLSFLICREEENCRV